MKENLEKMIADTMKAKDNVRLSVLRLIKSEFVKAEKSGKALDTLTENTILTKMVAQREDSIKQFAEGGRQDLVESETAELNILKEYAPKAVSDEEVTEFTNEVINNIKADHPLSMKDMKDVMTQVMTKYPTAKGKLISDVVRQNIG